MINFNFDSKVALITGGSKGIGKAIAMAFASSGAKVVICARGIAAGEETVRQIRDRGGEAIFVQTDVSQEEQVKNAVEKTIYTYGSLDFAINNAATVLVCRLLLAEYNLENWQQMISNNLTSVFLCLKYEILAMLEQGGGSIVNIASPAGIVGVPYLSSYSACKAGIIGLTKSAAIEYAKSNIAINCVTPGRTETEAVPEDPEAKALADEILASHPIGRIGQPEEIARVVLSMCCSTFTLGANWLVDGGVTAQ